MNKLILISLILNFCIPCIAQDSIRTKYEWSGYVKDLQSIAFPKELKYGDYTHLVHNRLNFKWKPSKKFTGAVEIRNRFYWGSEARNIILSNQSLRNENEKIDLSANWYHHGNIILHTNIERLWMEYRRSKWNLRAGRQRINWGLTNTWNPNDIFNTYNFLDFDYEERPGCDALKIQYMISEMSHVEVAVASSGKNKAIVAAKYLFNTKGYDIQFISGLYKNIFTGGVGWAGNIADLGFKGEAEVYLNEIDSLNSFNITTELDYIFKNGWYVNAGLLYNHRGLNSSISAWSDVSFKVSPSTLMPAKWNFLVSTSKEFTPIFSGSMGVVYAPGINMIIVLPSLKYNLLPNLDIDLIWQSFFSELGKKFQGVVHTGFVRMKWSF